MQVAFGFESSQLIPGHPQFACLAQNIIVDISHILDIVDVVAKKLQVTNQGVKGDISKGMTWMSCIVGCDAADIDAYSLIVFRDKFFERLGESIKEFHNFDSPR